MNPPLKEANEKTHNYYRYTADLALRWLKKIESGHFDELLSIFKEYLIETVQPDDREWSFGRFHHHYSSETALTSTGFNELHIREDEDYFTTRITGDELILTQTYLPEGRVFSKSFLYCPVIFDFITAPK